MRIKEAKYKDSETNKSIKKRYDKSNDQKKNQVNNNYYISTHVTLIYFFFFSNCLTNVEFSICQPTRISHKPKN